MKKIRILLALISVNVTYGQVTFQKYIQSTHAGFAGLFGNSIGYNPATSSIYVQANGHNGSATPPGFLMLDTCGNVITSTLLNNVGTMWTGDASYFNGTFSSILRTDGGGLGGFTSYIIKYDNAGNITSTNGVNTNASSVTDLHLVGIKTLPNGDILSTGYGPRTNNFKDIYCCKLSPTGQIIWGFYTGQFDSYWENGWGCDYDPVTMDCYFVGQNISFSQNNSTDIHIVKTDPNGTMLWEKNIATPATDVGWDVIGLPNHDVVIVASTTNNSAAQEEISLIKLDQNGNLIWSYKYTGPGQNNIIRKVSTLPNGNLLLTGYTNSFGTGGYDALNIEIDLNGNIVWQRAYGSADNDFFESATVVNNSLVSVGMRNFGNTASGIGYQVYLVKSKLDGTFTDASCNVTNCNFVRQVENYNIFNASNILATGAPVAVFSTTDNLPTNSTIICGKPQALYATLPSTVCLGTCVSLTDQSLNGVNSWTWTSTAGNITSPNTQHQNSICFNTVGTYTVKLKVANCTGGQDSISKVIDVLLGSNITISGPTSICLGNSTTLTASGATTYTWSTGSNSNSITVTPNGTTTYTVSSSLATCTSSAQTTVTVISVASISASSNTSVCTGKTVTLTASGLGSYTWSPSNSLNTANSATVIASPTTATTYTILGASGTCTAQTTVMVGVNPTPTVSIVASTNTICAGQNLALTGTGASSYTWSPAGSLSSTFGSPITATPTVNTTYILIGSSLAGCTNTAQTTISVTPSPTLSVTSATICAGQTATVTASGASTYTWSNGSHLNTLVVSPSTSTNYNVLAANGGVCSSFGQALVTVVNYPNAISNLISNVTCYGLSNGTITVNSIGTTGFNWSPNTSTTNIAVGLTAGIYTCTLSAGPGCNTIKTYTITEPSLLSGLPTYSNTSCGLCNGMAVSSPTGGTAPYHYNWQPTNTTQNSLTNLCPGIYTITVTDLNACNVTYSVDIQASPIFDATISASTYEIYPDELVLIKSGTGVTYTWTPNTYLSSSSSSSVQVSPLYDATFCVDITDSVGCTDTACVKIKVKCGEVFVPTAFSPNNDGHNDELNLYGNCIDELVFRIYDRWGEMIFETTSVKSKWDGTYKGNAVNAGVFVYQLTATLRSGESVSKKGNITLVR